MKTTESQPLSRPDALRRKLFRGAAGGVGVLLAVQAKTALGSGTCQSPSAQMSGNTSPRPGNQTTCSGGRSPGFWVQPQHSADWTTAGATFPTFVDGLEVCATGVSDLKAEDITNQGTLFSAARFNGAPADKGLWLALAFPDDYTQLLRHLVAAWLNAGYFASTDQKYPLSRDQIIDMWNATKSGGVYCPSGMSCGDAQKWSASDVIKYIEGMYDVNAEVDHNQLCKKRKS